MGATRVSLQLSGRFGPGLDAPSAGSLDTGERSAKQVGETEVDHCRSAGEVHRRNNPLGHGASGLERDFVRTSPAFCTATVRD